nr:poly [ADP-ribose] polymerase 14-like isoform X2 [Paramormyrops kingsleyae]
MDGKVLLLEGLPDQAASLKAKLELYFKNRRKSGGEVLEIQEHPNDRKKALLVYATDEDARKVLEKKIHAVDFKGLGKVDLIVKQHGEKMNTGIKRESRTPSPSLIKEKQEHCREAPGKQEQVTVCQESSQQGDGGTVTLLVSGTQSINENLLTMYFEQYSNNVNIKKHGEDGWILRLSNQSDTEKVLAEEDHRIGAFSFTVALYDERAEVERLDPHRFILSGFAGSCKHSIISIYIKSCSKGAEHSWETLSELGSLAVTFKQDIDIKFFLEKCSMKKLEDMEITASRMMRTDTILVEGKMDGISEEALKLYFNSKRSKGGNIRSLNWVDKTRSVTVTFRDWRVAHNVAEQAHSLGGVSLQAVLFYTHLQKALTGRTAPPPTAPSKITLYDDSVLLDHLSHNKKFKEQFEKTLQDIHARVSVDKTMEQSKISLEMTVDQESLQMYHVASVWESKARTDVESLLKRYIVIKLDAENEIWKRIKDTCLSLVSPDVSVFYEGPHHRILVVGQKNEANPVVDSVRLLVKNTSEELAIQRNTVVRMITLNSKEELGFLWNMVSSKVDGVEISKDDENLSIYLKGLTDPVSSAEMIIKKEKENLATKTLNISVHLAKFLKSLDLKKFEHDHFVQQKSQEGICAVILKCGDSYQILAEKKDIFKAEQTVMAVLKEEVLELTPEQLKVTKDENWRHFFGDLTEDVSNVKVLQSHKSIIMTGFCSAVTDISRKLKGYLNNKLPVTDDVTVESVEVLDFINDCMNLSEVPAIKVLNAIIVPSKTSLCLKVTAASDKIQEAISTVKNQLALIVKEKHTFLKAGEFIVLEKNQTALKAQAKEFGCMLHFPTEETSPAASARSYSHNIAGSITLTIVQGDMSCHSGDVLVCPLSGNLAFDNPIAQKVLKIGGPQIQEALKSLTKERNALIAGDVVLSKPGNLSAKILMYAGISAWGSSGHQLNGQTIEFIHLKSAILKCLTNAQDKKFTSIVMPALGCGTFGYPVSESCKAVIGAILEFCETYQGAPQDLRKILIVDPDIKIVEEFNNVANEIAGIQAHSGTMGKDTRPSDKANVTQPLQVPSNSGAVSRVLVGSMLVMLKKGDITQEKVDAIVNSTNSTLNLQTGVSGAILKAAGKSVTDECAKLGTQKEDGVVVTSGGSLSCKHIIQMVGPSTTAGITASIEKVLQLCENKTCAKVSIPAIGTGKGNIGPKESLQAILKGLENHSSKTASTCIRFVYIVALEDRVFQCLYEYFVEKTHPSLPKKQSSEEQLPANQVKIREVRLEVRKGNIVTETVRGIVNTTNKDLSLKGGVSGAILKAAGQSVEDECKKLSPLDDDRVAVTGGGALQCDFIIHMLGPHSCAAVTSRVERVLEECENNQITTVSFPAVGTGGGGLKAADAITAMLKGFETHLTRRASTVLKLVYVVIDKDDILKDVLQGLQLWKTKSTNESLDDDEEDWSSESEEEDQGSSSSSIKVVMGPIDIKAFCGDITKETTDAVVNSTNTSLNLNTGVSGAILKAAGNSVVDECKALGTQPSDGLVVTKPGKLPVKHIVHMVGQTTDKAITSSMCKVLKACNDIKVQSVSFPALGTGAGNLHADHVAVAMMDAIQNFLQDNPQPNVTSIHIVIFQQNMFSSFEQAMKKSEKLEKSKPVPKSSQSHPSLDITSLLANVTYPTMTVEVYGTTAGSLAQVKKCLEDLLAEECSSQDVEAQSLCFLQEAEKQAIIDLSNKHHLCVAVHVNKLTVSGKKDDVLMAVLKIKDLLQGAKERENQKFEKERIKKTVLWEKVKQGSWTSIKSNISYNLECAYIRQEKTYLFTQKGKTYKVNLEQMQMTNGKGINFKIRRTPLVGDSGTAVIQTPPTWTKMAGKNYIVVPLVATSQEYQNISKDFIASCQHFTKTETKRIEVVQIERLQHDVLWQSYSVRKQAIDKKYPKNPNEQMLYHGTTKEICQKINAYGFNRSFCGRNATKYGLGTYFAKEAYYSCYDSYSSPDDQGQKYIYRARVLTGKPCLGESGLKEPKALNPNDPQAGLHDCAVDKLQNPFIFVVFCDSGAYPEYLITFKAV